MTKPSGTYPPGAATLRRTCMILAALALSLLTSSLALADPPADGGHDRDHHEWRHDDHDHGDRHDRRRDEHGRDARPDWRRDDHDRGEHRAQYRYHARFDSGRYVRPHGWYMHRWHRGERLPVQFREPAYVIPNVAVYHLRPPPPGYYWVRVDNNAVLAAVATGVVVDVAFHLFH